MDVLSLALIGITAYFLFFGVVFGLMRGLARSIVRLITVGGAFAASWLCKDVYVNYLMELKLGEKSLREMVAGAFLDAAEMGELFDSLIAMVVGVLAFVLVFLLLKLVTEILFCIIGRFFPKGAKGLGAVVGLVQGALIAFCVCVPLNGLFLDFQTVSAMEISGEPILSENIRTKLDEAGVDFDAYEKGVVAKLYDSVGAEFYDALASFKLEDGGKVTLSGCVNAVGATMQFADELESISDLNFENGLNADARDSLVGTLQNLNRIKSEMDEDARKAMNEMVGAIVSDMGEDVPDAVKQVLSDFDIGAVDFEQEGDVILKLYDFAEEEGAVTSGDIVDSLAKTTLILPIMESLVESNGSAVAIANEETKAEVIAAINALEDKDAAASLRVIFGLN